MGFSRRVVDGECQKIAKGVSRPRSTSVMINEKMGFLRRVFDRAYHLNAKKVVSIDVVSGDHRLRSRLLQRVVDGVY